MSEHTGRTIRSPLDNAYRRLYGGQTQWINWNGAPSRGTIVVRQNTRLPEVGEIDTAELEGIHVWDAGGGTQRPFPTRMQDEFRPRTSQKLSQVELVSLPSSDQDNTHKTYQPADCLPVYFSSLPTHVSVNTTKG
jgi:hypothetical protein